MRTQKRYLKNGQFLSSFLGEPISFKKSIPYLNIDLCWWNFQKFMRTYLSWSGKKLVGETLFFHGQNFANMFYFHLFSVGSVIVSWHISMEIISWWIFWTSCGGSSSKVRQDLAILYCENGGKWQTWRSIFKMYSQI